MSLFTYEIAAPTNVVEASASPEPDDVSVVYIRIEATASKNITGNAIKEMRFEIQDLSNSNKGKALTRNLENITPVAKDFGRWTFSVPDDENKFIARPVVVTNENGTGTSGSGENAGILVKEGETLVFYLYDVEVIDQEGVSQVKVTEVYPNNTQETLGDLVTMRIRKINPNLRIDYFRANKYVTTVAKADPVTLSWATTSAETVELWGPDGENMLIAASPVFEHMAVGGKPIDTEFKDATIKLNSPPRTTSTYTLIAKGNAQDIDSPVALQQVTITVTDQVETNRLTGDQLVIHSDNGITMSSRQLEIHSNKAVTISSSLVATGNLRINGNVGIGTTDPTGHQLDVKSYKGGSENSAIRAAYGTPGSVLDGIEFGAIAERNGKWKALYAKAGNPNVLALYTDGDVNMMSGNVGIGTTTPEAKLDISGAANISEGVTVGGATTLKGNVDVGSFQEQDRFMTMKVAGGNKYRSGLKLWAWKENYGCSIQYDERNPAKGLHIKKHDQDVNGETLMFFNWWNGNVGIGTTTPGAKLDIKADADTTTVNGWYEAIRFSQEEHSAITFPAGGLLFGMHKNRNFYFADIKNGSFQKYVMQIEADTGNVGIGTTDPKGKLHIIGDLVVEGDLVRKYEDGNYYKLSNGIWPVTNWISKAISDQRYKSNINQISCAIERVTKLRGVNYQFNDIGLQTLTSDIEETLSAGPGATLEENQKVWDAERAKRVEKLSGTQMGLIAQEVESIVPEVVHTDEKGYKSIDYGHLTALLVEAIKDQQKLIDGLTTRLNTLEQVRI